MQAQLAGRRAFLSTLLSSAVVLHAGGSRSNRSPALFQFHSGFWVNLHLTLYAQAPDPAAADVHWRSALAYYKANLASRDLTFDSGVIKLKNELEDQENAERLTPAAELNTELIAMLERVAPFYRHTMWSKADQANRRWIKTITPLVAQYGRRLSTELSDFYQAPWPSDPVRVDVVNHANWAGAFTTLYPTRITISSVDARNQDNAGLEILFHEASHAIIDRLTDTLHAECKKQNVLLPRRDLSHAMLFYTTGEMVRRAIPGYVPYAEANGLWQSSWPMYIGPLQRDWQPYLDGKASFYAAISAIVKDVGQPNRSNA